MCSDGLQVGKRTTAGAATSSQQARQKVQNDGLHGPLELSQAVSLHCCCSKRCGGQSLLKVLKHTTVKNTKRKKEMVGGDEKDTVF